MKDLDFNEILWRKAGELFRPMPWRDNTQPYYVLVSELMLQQTQVDRVVPKFEQFMMLFPTIEQLAKVPLADVLTAWSGLGYNRRAKFLHQAAQKVMQDFGGVIPDTFDGLVSLPGVGPNTAGAILAYSFNQPVIFIETNVRTVYFHHFFQDQTVVTDKELKTLVQETIDTANPRQWYWALMDYGAYLKKQGVGRIDKSSHYKKQLPIKGSVREVRGFILKALAVHDHGLDELRLMMPPDPRFDASVKALVREGFIQQAKGQLSLMK